MFRNTPSLSGLLGILLALLPSLAVEAQQLPATVTLSNLTPTFTGAALAPTATTNPTGLPVQMAYRSLRSPAPTPTTDVVFNDTPEPMALSYASFGLSAGQLTALGNYVQLGGSSRRLSAVEAVLVTWAKASSWPALAAANPAGYYHPITVTIYEVTSTNQLIYRTEATQSVLIPWRPLTRADGSPYPFNGFAFRASVSFPSGFILPERVLVSVGFDTQNYGLNPIGVAGPYNSLNIAAKESTNPTWIGSDVNPDVVLQVKGNQFLYPSTGWTSSSVPMLRIFAQSTESITPPTDAGSWQVTARVSNAAYLGTTSSTFTIRPATATIQLSDLLKTYTGAPQSPTAVTTPAGVAVSFTYNGSATAPTLPGTYPVTATSANANYTGSTTGSMVIQKAPATIQFSNLTQTFDGAAKTVSFTTVPAGLNATIQFTQGSTPSAVGSYPFTATINDPLYSGSASGTLVIQSATPPPSDLPATLQFSNLSQVYDGTAKTVSYTTDPPGLAASVVFANNAVPVDAGSYPFTATITSAGYTGSRTGTLVIEKAAATIALANLTQTYDGTTRSVTTTTTPSGLGVTVAFAEGKVPVDAGSYPFTATIVAPNHSGSTTGTLVIEKAAATIALANLTQTYDGTTRAVATTTTPSSLDVSIAFAEGKVPVDAGSYPFTATINAPNHRGSTAGTLVIEKAAATIALANLTQTYDGTTRAVTTTTTPSGLDVSIAFADGKVPVDAGSYPFTATIVAPNHSGSTTGTLVIEKAPTTIALANLTQTYDGTTRSVKTTTTPSGLEVSIAFAEGKVPVDAGSYPFTATINAPNHRGSTAGTLVIEKATATIALAKLTQTYDGTTRAVATTTTPSSLDVSIAFAEGKVPVDAGSYPFTATINAPNHRGSTTGTLVIERASAQITLSKLTQTYDGTTKAPSFTTLPEGLVVGVEFDGGKTPVAAGSFTFTATVEDGNYEGRIESTLLIEKAVATVKFADLMQIPCGNPRPVTVITNPPNLATVVTYNGSRIAPTLAGRYRVVAQVEDPNHTGETSGELCIGQPLSNWLNNWTTVGTLPPTGTGPQDDPDDDGVSNLMEFALGLNPAGTDDDLPHRGLPVLEKNPDSMDFIFRKNLAALDLDYVVEASDSLTGEGGWSPAVVETTVLSEENNVQTVKVSMRTPAHETRKFMRLKVVQREP